MVQTGVSAEWLLHGFSYELQATTKPQTANYYCREVSRFLRWARTSGVPQDIRLITKHDVYAFFHYLAIGSAGSEPNSVERRRWPYYRALRRFFDWAVKEGFLERSPMDGIKLKAPLAPPIEPYRQEHIEQMLRVLDCFAELSKEVTPSDLWEELVRLIEYLIHRDRWTDAFSVIDKYERAGRNADRVQLRCRVVRELAYSGVTRESLPRDQRQLYEKFIDWVLKVNDWQRYLSPQEVGAALERIGAFNKTLDFYWRFVDDPELRQFARGRWILNKRRQEDHFRNQGQKARAEQISVELSNRAHDWGIRLDRLGDLPYYPTLTPEKGREEFVDQREKFQIGHIEVILLRDKKLALLMDTHSLTTLRVDLMEGKVNGQEVKQRTPRSGELVFDVPESGYRGTAFYGGERPRIELEVQGVAGTVSIGL